MCSIRTDLSLLARKYFETDDASFLTQKAVRVLVWPNDVDRACPMWLNDRSKVDSLVFGVVPLDQSISVAIPTSELVVVFEESEMDTLYLSVYRYGRVLAIDSAQGFAAKQFATSNSVEIFDRCLHCPSFLKLAKFLVEVNFRFLKNELFICQFSPIMKLIWALAPSSSSVCRKAGTPIQSNVENQKSQRFLDLERKDRIEAWKQKIDWSLFAKEVIISHTKAARLRSLNADQKWTMNLDKLLGNKLTLSQIVFFCFDLFGVALSSQREGIVLLLAKYVKRLGVTASSSDKAYILRMNRNGHGETQLYMMKATGKVGEHPSGPFSTNNTKVFLNWYCTKEPGERVEMPFNHTTSLSLSNQLNLAPYKEFKILITIFEELKKGERSEKNFAPSLSGKDRDDSISPSTIWTKAEKTSRNHTSVGPVGDDVTNVTGAPAGHCLEAYDVAESRNEGVAAIEISKNVNNTNNEAISIKKVENETPVAISGNNGTVVRTPAGNLPIQMKSTTLDLSKETMDTDVALEVATATVNLENILQDFGINPENATVAEEKIDNFAPQSSPRPPTPGKCLQFDEKQNCLISSSVLDENWDLCQANEMNRQQLLSRHEQTLWPQSPSKKQRVD